MTQENQLPETVITTSDLAWDIAHTEKPYQELALAAKSLGLEAEVDDAKVKANEAGLAAGRAAIAEMQAQVEAGAKTKKPATTEGVSLHKEAAEQTTIWDTLSPEKQTQAHATIMALAEKFDKKEEEFSLVETADKKGEKVLSAVYNGNGIDLGDPKKDYDKKRSYDVVKANKHDKNFLIEVDGKQLDTRNLTEAVYRAMVADAKARELTLPDSEQMAKENEDVWAYSLLTGEPADGSYARFARVYGDGRPRSDWYGRGYGLRGVRFRPAVVVE